MREDVQERRSGGRGDGEVEVLGPRGEEQERQDGKEVGGDIDGREDVCVCGAGDERLDCREEHDGGPELEVWWCGHGFGLPAESGGVSKLVVGPGDVRAAGGHGDEEQQEDGGARKKEVREQHVRVADVFYSILHGSERCGWTYIRRRSRRHADLCEDADGKDDHTGRRRG